MTRGWYLYLPARGAPTLIHHRIEAEGWEQALPDAGIARKSWMSHAQLDALLRETLQGAKRVAMEYSPRGEVPYVRYGDAGAGDHGRAGCVSRTVWHPQRGQRADHGDGRGGDDTDSGRTVLAWVMP